MKTNSSSSSSTTKDTSRATNPHTLRSLRTTHHLLKTDQWDINMETTATTPLPPHHNLTIILPRTPVTTTVPAIPASMVNNRMEDKSKHNTHNMASSRMVLKAYTTTIHPNNHPATLHTTSPSMANNPLSTGTKTQRTHNSTHKIRPIEV